MTARRIATPIRHASDPLEAAPADLLAQAQADVETARAVVDKLRRRVAARQDGAAELHSAEYRLQGALRRLDALGGKPPDRDPPAAA